MSGHMTGSEPSDWFWLAVKECRRLSVAWPACANDSMASELTVCCIHNFRFGATLWLKCNLFANRVMWGVLPWDLFCCVVVCAIATILQLYLGGDMIMRWRGESPSLHFYWHKGSLTSHTMLAWHERNWLWWLCKLHKEWISMQLSVMAVTGFVPQSPGY